MKELLASLLAATGVAWAVAQETVMGVLGRTYLGVSGALLTVITESLQTRQGRSLTRPYAPADSEWPVLDGGGWLQRRKWRATHRDHRQSRFRRGRGVD